MVEVSVELHNSRTKEAMDTLGSGLGSCDTIDSGVAKWVRVGLVHPISLKAFPWQMYVNPSPNAIVHHLYYNI